MEGKPLYRTKHDRRNDVKTTKSTWFRKLGATTTLKVPMTKNSELAKELRLVLGQYPGPKGTSIKIQEQPGRPLHSGIISNNPFKNGHCHKGNCPLGQKPCDGLCSQENIVYKAICTICRDFQIDTGIDDKDIVDRQYTGETSRTLRIRSEQHYKDYLKCNRLKIEPNSDHSSFMWDHHSLEHNDREISKDDYEFDIINKFNDAMTRQIEEAVRIQTAIQSGIHIDNKGKSNLIKTLNRKNEHFTARKRFNYD